MELGNSNLTGFLELAENWKHQVETIHPKSWRPITLKVLFLTAKDRESGGCHELRRPSKAIETLTATTETLADAQPSKSHCF